MEKKRKLNKDEINNETDAESEGNSVGKVHFDTLARGFMTRLDVLAGWVNTQVNAVEEWFEDCLDKVVDGLLRGNIEDRQNQSDEIDGSKKAIKQEEELSGETKAKKKV